MKFISYWIFLFGTVYLRIRQEKLHGNLTSKGSKYYLVKTKKGHGKINNKMPVMEDVERRTNASKYLGI